MTFLHLLMKGKLTDMNTDVIGVHYSFFADDILLIGSSETELQFLLNKSYVWRLRNLTTIESCRYL